MYHSFVFLHISLMPGLIEDGRLLISELHLPCSAMLYWLKFMKKTQAHTKSVAGGGNDCSGLLAPHFENQWLHRTTSSYKALLVSTL